MRFALTGALFLGLLAAADVTYLGASRSLGAYHRDNELRMKQYGVFYTVRSGLATEEEQKSLKESSEVSSELYRHLVHWQGTSFAALGFLGCGLIWVLIAAARRANEPGSLPNSTLKGSMIGAIVIGIFLPCFFGFGNWLDGDRVQNYDRLMWEARGLIGAIGGAAGGALVGLFASGVLRLFRQNQNSGKADIQASFVEPNAPADRPRE